MTVAKTIFFTLKSLDLSSFVLGKNFQPLFHRDYESHIQVSLKNISTIIIVSKIIIIIQIVVKYVTIFAVKPLSVYQLFTIAYNRLTVALFSVNVVYLR